MKGKSLARGPDICLADAAMLCAARCVAGGDQGGSDWASDGGGHWLLDQAHKHALISREIIMILTGATTWCAGSAATAPSPVPSAKSLCSPSRPPHSNWSILSHH